MPCRLPSLENIGTVIIILKLAKGEMPACELLLGVMYGSAGATTTLLATIVLGGKLKVDQTELLAKAAAIVLRSVVIAGVGIIRP
jgi:predicted neutral ceramidase superfamily lipid hydrolase